MNLMHRALLVGLTLGLMALSCVAGIAVTLFALPRLATVGVVPPVVLSPGGAPSEEVEETFKPFWEAWAIVRERYVDPAETEPQALTYGAIRGLVDAVGDVGHSRFLSPEERELQRTAIAGAFGGIGAEVGEQEGRIVIVAPLENSPAEAAGIRAGDVLLEIDGRSTEGMTVTEAVMEVRGEIGSEVTLLVFHPEATSARTVTITRDNIELPAASWTMLPGNVAYLRMNQFSANLHDSLQAILQEAQAAGAERYLIDVRNNPGGLVNQVVAVTSEFLPEGTIFIQRSRDEAEERFTVTGQATLPDQPVVVLINRGSASAAEIFAGALKDQGRALLVGETTFGTGTVLNSFALSDGSALLLGVAEWLTPSGHLIKGNGIEPDVAIPLPPEVRPLSPQQVVGWSQEALDAVEDTQFLEGYRRLLDR